MIGVRTARFVAFWQPKGGTAAADWEDGCAYSPGTGWFAVTDGASTGTRSREWAYFLAKSFVEDRPTDLFHSDGRHGERFGAWAASVRSRFDPHAGEFDGLRTPTWVRAIGDERGAFCTFLGGRLTDTGWTALALGDCCLFQVDATDQAVRTFPLSSPSEIGSTPLLVPSVAVDEVGIEREVALASGPFGPADLLFVATDALSEWMLTARDHPSLWPTLGRLTSTGFSSLCAELRGRREMRNDDVTLLRCVGARWPGELG
jgi:hypothetical protein